MEPIAKDAARPPKPKPEPRSAPNPAASLPPNPSPTAPTRATSISVTPEVRDFVAAQTAAAGGRLGRRVSQSQLALAAICVAREYEQLLDDVLRCLLSNADAGRTL